MQQAKSMNGQFVSSLLNCKADLRPILLFLVLNINHPHHFTASTEMRIPFGAILLRYLSREFYSDVISTRVFPTTGLTEFTRL